MRLPRDLSGDELAAKLGQLGYRLSRQSGSHLRLSTEREGEHHVTVPRHGALRIGTLSGILRDVAEHLGFTREQLLDELFGRGA
jgi:predicted RNA binding protein YcfA (HicA-like mRNA interferase family)